MFLLTKHAKEKIKKRLIKKSNVDSFQIWKAALDFARQSDMFYDKKFIYFTNYEYTLIVTKDFREPLSRREALKLLRENKHKEFNVFDSETSQLYRVDRIRAFRLAATKGVYLSKKSEDIFIGKPRIAITLRPFKESDVKNL